MGHILPSPPKRLIGHHFYSSSTCRNCWLLLSHWLGTENCPLKGAVLARSRSVPEGSLCPMTNQGRVTMALFLNAGQLWQAISASELLTGSSEICLVTLMPCNFLPSPAPPPFTGVCETTQKISVPQPQNQKISVPQLQTLFYIISIACLQCRLILYSLLNVHPLKLLIIF